MLLVEDGNFYCGWSYDGYYQQTISKGPYLLRYNPSETKWPLGRFCSSIVTVVEYGPDLPVSWYETREPDNLHHVHNPVNYGFASSGYSVWDFQCLVPIVWTILCLGLPEEEIV